MGLIGTQYSYTYQILYPDMGTTWTDITANVRQDITIDLALCNEQFKPVVGSVDFEIVFDNLTLQKLMWYSDIQPASTPIPAGLVASTGILPLKVLANGTPIFYGYVQPVDSPSFVWAGQARLTLKAQDKSYLMRFSLNTPIQVNGVTSGALWIRNPSNHAQSILDQVIGILNTYLASVGITESITIDPAFNTASGTYGTGFDNATNAWVTIFMLPTGTKIVDAISEFLWEYGWIYYFDGGGTMRFVQWYGTNVGTGIPYAFSDTAENIIDNSFKISRQSFDEDSVRVKYYTQAYDLSGMPVYTVNPIGFEEHNPALEAGCQWVDDNSQMFPSVTQDFSSQLQCPNNSPLVGLGQVMHFHCVFPASTVSGAKVINAGNFWLYLRFYPYNFREYDERNYFAITISPTVNADGSQNGVVNGIYLSDSTVQFTIQNIKFFLSNAIATDGSISNLLCTFDAVTPTSAHGDTNFQLRHVWMIADYIIAAEQSPWWDNIGGVAAHNYGTNGPRLNFKDFNCQYVFDIPNRVFEFAPAAVNTTNSTITIPQHGLASGMLCTFTANAGDTLPSHLTAGDDFIITVRDANTLSFSDINNNPVTLATQGTTSSNFQMTSATANPAQIVNIAKAIKTNLIDNRMAYTVASYDDVAIGDLAQISISKVGISMQGIVVEKRFARQTQQYQYKIKGINSLPQINPATNPLTVTPAQQGTVLTQLGNAIDSTGAVKQAIVGNLLPTGQTPSLSGLYFYGDSFGYWNQTTASWPVKIDDAGNVFFGSTTASFSFSSTGTLSITGAQVKSGNYVLGSAGWSINTDGSAEFNNVTVRGDIYAAVGTIGGWTIGATKLTAGASGSAQIALDMGLLRVSIIDTTGTTKVALGYLNGLPKNSGVGNWGVADYGFYSATGNAVTIDGSVKLQAGDWLIQSDASFKITSDGTSTGTVYARLGTYNGNVGIFLNEVNFNASGLPALSSGALINPPSGSVTAITPSKFFVGNATNFMLFDGSALSLALTGFFVSALSTSVYGSLNISSIGSGPQALTSPLTLTTDASGNSLIDATVALALKLNTKNANPTIVGGNLTINGLLAVPNGTLVLGGVNHGDATLHIQSIQGGTGRLTQMNPGAGSSLDALNLIGSQSSTGTTQWFSWGVSQGNFFYIVPGTTAPTSQYADGLTIDSLGQALAPWFVASHWIDAPYYTVSGFNLANTAGPAYVGHWQELTLISGNTASVLPGTSATIWAYFGSNNGTSFAGVAAGGTTVWSGTAYNFFGFCWRVQ